MSQLEIKNNRLQVKKLYLLIFYILIFRLNFLAERERTKKDKWSKMVAVCEAINILPIVIFPFGTLKKMGLSQNNKNINTIYENYIYSFIKIFTYIKQSFIKEKSETCLKALTDDFS